MSLGANVDNNFVVKSVIFCLAVTFLMTTMISVFVPTNTVDGTQEISDKLLEDYHRFTGSSVTTETPWILDGIYTPYLGNTYGYTTDGWLYGSKVTTYSPSQYAGTDDAYTVSYDSTTHTFKYTSAATRDTSYSSGDVYSSVCMSKAYKSDVFFTPAGKTMAGEHFYYEYSGYRYALKPNTDIHAVNQDGTEINVNRSTTSLSLIWYEYNTSSGIAGQLVLSGNDSGVSYLTANEIVNTFNSANNTAKFKMSFNGVDLNVYIKINPYYTASGLSVEDCYNNGYWELMVTSTSVSAATYTNADYSFNIYEIWNTLVDLVTFNTDNYDMSPAMGTLASLTINVCFFAILVSLGLTCYPILIFAGIYAVIQAINFSNIFGGLGGIFG